MKKPSPIQNPILARAFLIDPKLVDVNEVCPTDPAEFLEWWWNTKAIDCVDCPLFQTRNSVVKPDGIYGAPIMVVGEGPGFLEDLCAVPLVGPMELRSSKCNKCNNCSSCFKSRVLSHPEARTGARRVIKCNQSVTTKEQATSEFYIRSAGSVFDGILLEKWKFTYPRHNWIQFYNEHNQDNPWTHKSPWYITNTIMCRAVDSSKLKDEPPPAVAMAKCKKHLVYQVAALEPKIIVALGTKAKEILLGTTKSKQVERGEIVQSKFGPVICDVHPAHLMRETQKEFVGYGYAKIGDTLQKALDYVGLVLHEPHGV